MSSITTERITEGQKEAAKRVSVADLAADRYGVALRRESAREQAGPCPKCGGDDRFHCTDDWFICRQCHPKRGDSIELVRWLSGASFREAVASLTGETLPAPASAARRQPPERKASRPAEQWRSPAWQRRAEELVSRAQEALWALPLGHEALIYLEQQRALEDRTWLAYRLGYEPAAPLPGTEGKQKAPAVVIPWLVGGKLRAVRYRFLSRHEYTDSDGKERSAKQTALAGSGFAGVLYGGHAGLRGAAEGLRWLLICEGEINAMSCWQVAHSSHVDVLSIGSESAQISPKMVDYAGQYRRVLVWADRGEQAQRLMLALPGAYGVRSPGGRDANDLLKEGALGGFLAAQRANAARSVSEIEALLWALYDAADALQGIDAGSAQVLQRLARQEGKQASIFEAEPDRWLTERWRE